MDDRQDRPVWLRVRDEARDVVPLNFGPFLAAARGRAGEGDLDEPGETRSRTSNDAVRRA